MHKQPDKPSFFEKLATAIVDRRNLIFFLYLCALIFSLFSQGWVKVCNDLTQYLPENTETRQGSINWKMNSSPTAQPGSCCPT